MIFTSDLSFKTFALKRRPIEAASTFSKLANSKRERSRHREIAEVKHFIAKNSRDISVPCTSAIYWLQFVDSIRFYVV